MTGAPDARKTSAGEGAMEKGHEALFVQARLDDETPVACGDVPLERDRQGV